MTGALYLRYFCIPFFQQNDLSYCKRVAAEPEILANSTFAEDTKWLTREMCGQPHMSISQTEAEQLVLLAHQELPKDNRVIKNYCIDRCKSIRVGTGRGNSKRKMLNNAAEICRLPLLRPLHNMK